LKGPENTLFSRFYFHLALATLFSPPFDFKTAPQHSFHRLSILKHPRDTLFTAFQNHLAPATAFPDVFKTVSPFRTLSAEPTAYQRQAVSKAVGAVLFVPLQI
jgi:hypothetical protein